MTNRMNGTIAPDRGSRMVLVRSFAFLLALACAGAALAGASETFVKGSLETSIPDFLQRQDFLRQDLQASTKFAHVDNESKQRIYAAQDVLFRILGDKQSIDELSEQERLEAYNAQNEIAAVLTDAELDRPICQNRPRLGSHLGEVTCVSRRAIEQGHDVVKRRLLEPIPCYVDKGFCKSI